MITPEMIEDACEAEELFSLDELEQFAKQYNNKKEEQRTMESKLDWV